jgi:uncharacterized protein YaaR (DUF327 family)
MLRNVIIWPPIRSPGSEIADSPIRNRHLLERDGLNMKIRSDKPSAIRCKDSRGIVPRKGASSIFSGELIRQEGKLLDDERQALDELRERLFDAGEKLEKDPTIANLTEFCELIGKFAKKANSLAYRVETVTSDFGGRPLDIITIIDREVDELYHLVMQGQQCRILIAAKISSIKGLIVKLKA